MAAGIKESVPQLMLDVTPTSEKLYGLVYETDGPIETPSQSGVELRGQK